MFKISIVSKLQVLKYYVNANLVLADYEPFCLGFGSQQITVVHDVKCPCLCQKRFPGDKEKYDLLRFVGALPNSELIKRINESAPFADLMDCYS